jgi:hypothetical protein
MIVHQLQNMQHCIVKLFRHRDDAGERLKALCYLEPGKNFVIIFDTADCEKEVQ